MRKDILLSQWHFKRWTGCCISQMPDNRGIKKGRFRRRLSVRACNRFYVFWYSQRSITYSIDFRPRVAIHLHVVSQYETQRLLFLDIRLFPAVFPFSSRESLRTVYSCASERENLQARPESKPPFGFVGSMAANINFIFRSLKLGHSPT